MAEQDIQQQTILSSIEESYSEADDNSLTTEDVARSETHLTHKDVIESFEEYVKTLSLKEIRELLISRETQKNKFLNILRLQNKERESSRNEIRQIIHMRVSTQNNKEYIAYLLRLNRIQYREEQETFAKNPEIGPTYVTFVALNREKSSLLYYLQTEVIPLEKERNISKRLRVLDDEIDEQKDILKKYGYFEKIENSMCSQKNRYYHEQIKAMNITIRRFFNEVHRLRKESMSTNRTKIAEIKQHLNKIREESKILINHKNEIQWDRIKNYKGSSGHGLRKSFRPSGPSKSSEDIIDQLKRGEEYLF